MPGKDKAEFDCDAFIELDDSTWANITAEFGQFELNKATLQDLNAAGWPPASALLRIEGEIARALGKVSGYKKQGGIGKFEFMIQGARKSAGQVHAGQDYPEGAIGKKYPAIESALPRGVNDKGQPVRKWNEIHKESV